MSEVPPENRPEKKRGVALFLTLGLLAGLGACVFAYMHVSKGMDLAAVFGLELSTLAQLLGKYVVFGFVLPVVVWLAGMAITKAGRAQHNVGVMLAVLLFGFAILWAGGAVMAFMQAYDPPRENRQPSGVIPSESMD